ncbi:GGDEF domain-containing protein [Enterobacter hormaechei]|uniref:GGDEF domain-containing protein n=1 Tax=Enterobacter hormaechei TaxID=158836 RepID=UPI00308F1037|nr:GGDEF domain-containing protein [Enterobacter hormaechei]
MRIPEIKKIKYTSWMYSILFSALAVVIASGFIYIFQRSHAADKVFEIRSLLITVFDENEDIADAITAKYTTLLQNENCISHELFKEQDVYGFNYSEKSSSNIYKGTLLSLFPLDKKSDCLVEAVSFIISSLKSSDLITNNNFRYVLSEKKKLIYSFRPLASADFNISNSKMFNDMQTFVETVPEYYERKLTRNIQDKGTVATPLYKDKLSGRNAYSVVSFIYNLNESDRPVAYLLYDHSFGELTDRIQPFIQDMPWLTVSITETATGRQLCVIKCDNVSGDNTADLSEPLSGRYMLSVRMDITESITASLFFKIILVLVILHSFVLQNLIKARMLRNKEASVIDHLTRLYNRKVIPLIRNSISSRNHIVIMDCNRFKEINDRYGHNAGDDVLIFIGDTIKNETRKDDIAIRHGGDEFMIILDVFSPDEADAVIRRISSRISEKEFHFGNGTVKASVSYGIAAYKGNLQLAIHDADQKMYAMKNGLYATG